MKWCNYQPTSPSSSQPQPPPITSPSPPPSPAPSPISPSKFQFVSFSKGIFGGGGKGVGWGQPPHHRLLVCTPPLCHMLEKAVLYSVIWYGGCALHPPLFTGVQPGLVPVVVGMETPLPSLPPSRLTIVTISTKMWEKGVV